MKRAFESCDSVETKKIALKILLLCLEEDETNTFRKFYFESDLHTLLESKCLNEKNQSITIISERIIHKANETGFSQDALNGDLDF